MSATKRTSKAKAAPSASGKALANRLRIIGGRWRGVRIDFPPLPAVRPSPDRVRETLFNWLQTDIADARCLDLFAGSGALGIEALSRGASEVTFVDVEPQIGVHLRSTLQRLGATNTRVEVADALKFLGRDPQSFDIVFLDPPFASRVLPEVVKQLATRGWLRGNAFVYLECSAMMALPNLPQGWAVYRSKRAGQVGYHLLRVNAVKSTNEEAS